MNDFLRHVIFRGERLFPTIATAASEAFVEPSEKKWNEVRKEITIVAMALQAAISILQEPEIFRSSNNLIM